MALHGGLVSRTDAGQPTAILMTGRFIEKRGNWRSRVTCLAIGLDWIYTSVPWRGKMAVGVPLRNTRKQ
jgi:hypothetical protein